MEVALSLGKNISDGSDWLKTASPFFYLGANIAKNGFDTALRNSE
jgi:hypothetical protein